MIPGITATGPIFNPAQLFQAAEQGAWYDPSDLTTLFQDTAGTTPVTTAGQSVALMKDKSGNGADISQATSADMPTYELDTNGLPYLSLNGTSQFMSTAATLTSPQSTGWVLATANIIATGGGAYPGLWRFLSAGGSPTATTANYMEEYEQSKTALNKIVCQRYPSIIVINENATPIYPAAGSPFVSMTNYSGTSGVATQTTITPGSTATATRAAITSGASNLYLGQGYGGEMMAGRIYGFVFRNAATSSAIAALLAAWLANKSGA